MSPCPAFYTGSGDSNAGPQAPKASPSATGLAPQPCTGVLELHEGGKKGNYVIPSSESLAFPETRKVRHKQQQSLPYDSQGVRGMATLCVSRDGVAQIRRESFSTPLDTGISTKVEQQSSNPTETMRHFKQAIQRLQCIFLSNGI